MFFASTTFTWIHTALSLIGIAAGLVAALGLLRGQLLRGWTAAFLAATILTSVTGFLFPFGQFLPSHGVGAISLVVLAAAVLALYVFHAEGGWRAVYVVSAMAALYFNVFVLVVQAFRKLPFLHTLAPTESEPPFAIAQAIVLLLFVVLTVLALRAFHPRAAAMA
jgi:hypothetical protein